MTHQANKKRQDVQFDVGDKVFLKLCPYPQLSVKSRIHPKLAVRFYWLFLITAEIGAVAYELILPPEAKVHSIFHVSQLKRVTGDHAVVTSLPPELVVDEPIPIQIETILNCHSINQNSTSVPQVLIKWQGYLVDEATWMDESDL